MVVGKFILLVAVVGIIGPITALTAACSAIVPIEFPEPDHQEFFEPSPTAVVEIFPTRMLAYASGTLTYGDGCMYLNAQHANTPLLLVWALDPYSIEIKDDRITFEDMTPYGSSSEWIFGTEVTFSGGSTTQKFMKRFPHQPIPEHCVGDLFLIGSAS